MPPKRKAGTASATATPRPKRTRNAAESEAQKTRAQVQVVIPARHTRARTTAAKHAPSESASETAASTPSKGRSLFGNERTEEDIQFETEFSELSDTPESIEDELGKELPLVAKGKGRGKRRRSEADGDSAAEMDMGDVEEDKEKEEEEYNPKKRSRATPAKPKAKPKSKSSTTKARSKGSQKVAEEAEAHDGTDDEDVDWEDVFDAAAPTTPASKQQPLGDISVTIDKDELPIPSRTGKKGPTAIERQIRLAAHMIHVQCLLYHGSIRNLWINDKEVQATLLGLLGPGVKAAWEKFKGQVEALEKKAEKDARKKKGKGKAKEKERESEAITKPENDPLVHFVGTMFNFWKQRFEVQGEGLRKKGYFPISWQYPQEGEVIKDRAEFRERAKECRGSRDLGAQLFTALLRAAGVRTRMVFSLQPLGFGFTKDEDRILEDKKTGSTPEKKPKKAPGDNPDPPPVFWSEVFSPFTRRWYPCDGIYGRIFYDETLVQFFTPKPSSQAVVAYIIAYNDNGVCKDVTVRYLKNRIFPGKTKGKRVPVRDVPIYDTNGKVLKTFKRDWFKRVMLGYISLNKTPEDLAEDEELKPAPPPEKKQVESIAGYKGHPTLVLVPNHLNQNEEIRPDAKPVRYLTVKNHDPIPLYSRADIVIVKPAPTWYHAGRLVDPNATPLKYITKKNHTAPTPLYAEFQTSLFTHPPVTPDQPLPKNSYGDIDLFHPWMLPPGTAHVRHPLARAVAKRLGIDYVEAVTGFEGHGRRRVPTRQGVVVRAGMEDMVMDACAAEGRERERRAGEKRSIEAARRWLAFLKKLRVRERFLREHGEGAGFRLPGEDREEGAGGFIRETEKVGGSVGGADGADGGGLAGGFLPEGDGEDDGEDVGEGGFLREDVAAAEEVGATSRYFKR